MPFLQFKSEIDWIKKNHEEIHLKDGIRMPFLQFISKIDWIKKTIIFNSEIDWINVLMFLSLLFVETPGEF